MLPKELHFFWYLQLWPSKFPSFYSLGKGKEMLFRYEGDDNQQLIVGCSVL